MHCTTNFKDLLKSKHMLVEELLELLIDVVNADLFKAVVVKDLKAGDVEDTDVGDLLHGWVAWISSELKNCKRGKAVLIKIYLHRVSLHFSTTILRELMVNSAQSTIPSKFT